jgi:hypothetical protein
MDDLSILLVLLLLFLLFGVPIISYLMYNSVNNKGLNDAKSLK